MDNRDALLQAIIHAPDDDAPRLAYADAAERSGDRDRAEFIRVQCTLDRSPPDSAERTALASREKDLLAQHGWEWAEEFGKPPGETYGRPKVHEWVYRRGFIERVEMYLGGTSEEILDVFRRAPIRHVRDTSQIDELGGLVGALPHLECLTGLEFWTLYAFKNARVAELLASPHLRNLRTLILHHDRNGNVVQQSVLVKAMASPYRSNLEELGVNIDDSWRGPSRAILAAMAASPYLRRLRKLNLSYAGDTGNAPEMDVKTARLMRDSPNFVGLEELDLRGANFPLAVWDEVLKWPWLSNLKTLYLCGVGVPDPASHTVSRLTAFPTYPAAFEERVGRVDWETEYITPVDGDTCWHGLTWEKRPGSATA